MWRQRLLSTIFSVVIAGCLAFVVPTLAAMLFYPGGPSPIPAVMFFIALTMAGNSLVFFFILIEAFSVRTAPFLRSQS